MQSELAIHHYLARWDVAWQLQEALKKQGIELSEDEYVELENLCKNGMYFREGSQSPSQHTSFVGNIMASRIAALWDFTGPAFTISCDKNPGFRALEVAQNMLSLGEVDAVVVGAVDFAGGLEHVLLKHQQNPLSDNQNPTLSFDTLENGFQIGEGAGVVVLKRNKEVSDEKYTQLLMESGNVKTK